MAPSRHNLSRRALLGAGVGAWVMGGGAAGRASGGAADAEPFAAPFGAGLWNPVLSGAEGPSTPSPGEQGSAGLRQAQPERREDEARARWARTLSAYRRCERRIAAFKAGEALLPAERRAFPACRPLERRFGDLNDRRFAVLRRLFRLPAPDLSALALKLELAVEDQAWELTGAEDCLVAIAADARRLARNDRGGAWNRGG